MAEPLHEAPIMRLMIASALFVVGCASRYRVEPVGTGQAVVVSRAATTVPTPVAGMPLPRGSYDFKLHFDIPRAQVIEWKVTCPGVALDGTVGETFDAYRERRITEITHQIKRDRARANAVANVVGGVVRGRARVGRTTVDVEAAPVVEAPEPVVELAPFDTGSGALAATVRVSTTENGACSVTALADDSAVRASFHVTRIRDLKMEADERRIALDGGAVDIRTRVRTQLVTAGADEGARQRRLDAEARLRAEREAREGQERQRRIEAELRVRADLEVKMEAERQRRLQIELRLRAEREARAEAERLRRLERERIEARIRWEAEAPRRARIALIERQRTIAVTHRTWYISWLVGECKADPNRRERVAAERIERERLIAIRIEAERQERIRIQIEHERRIGIRVEAERAERARLQAEAEARAAEIQQRRVAVAFDVRTRITGYLVGSGAKLRPPRPQPRIEDPGSAPFDGARWIAGTWTWTGGQWIWRAGGWTDPDRFGHAGGDVVVTTVERPTVVVPTAPVTIQVGIPQPTVIIRDRPVRERRDRDRRRDRKQDDDDKQRDHRRHR